MVRYAVVHLSERVWELRENLSAYGVSYVALAESLGCALLYGGCPARSRSRTPLSGDRSLTIVNG